MVSYEKRECICGLKNNFFAVLNLILSSIKGGSIFCCLVYPTSSRVVFEVLKILAAALVYIPFLFYYIKTQTNCTIFFFPYIPTIKSQNCVMVEIGRLSRFSQVLELYLILFLFFYLPKWDQNILFFFLLIYYRIHI